MKSGSTPLLCSAATVAMRTPPTTTLPPKRASIALESWMRRSVESLCQQMDGNPVVVIEGVDTTSWDAWRVFLKEFEVASRHALGTSRERHLR
ncbi:hypothetical protein [Variovorax sp. dw_954]|uniref:hypothetical protein n=1 Tax=Variovorax sp. dw_954 TaxID=2720078 RepID=UPI001BD22531|nr:hypothetical protein [Variovorax sp. dw_954]